MDQEGNDQINSAGRFQFTNVIKIEKEIFGLFGLMGVVNAQKNGNLIHLMGSICVWEGV